MNLLNKLINNPVFTLAWISFVEILIRQGYLLPTQREIWVSDGGILIAELGLVILLSLHAHHVFDLWKKQKLATPVDEKTFTQHALEIITYLSTFKGLLLKKQTTETVVVPQQ